MVVFLLVAVSVAVTAPTLLGANCTAMVHDWPGPRLIALQVLAELVKALEPDRVTLNTPLAPPELVSVNVWEAVWLVVTGP
jgi:hypothetical protein